MITGPPVFELEARLWCCSEEAEEREHIEGDGEAKTSSALRFPRTRLGRQTMAEADMACGLDKSSLKEFFDELIWLCLILAPALKRPQQCSANLVSQGSQLQSL